MGVLTQTTAEVQENLNWYISKTEGEGIKVDTTTPTFPWVDLIGLVQPDSSNPTTAPSKEVFQTGVNAYAYAINDELDTVFHIPHDWVTGSAPLVHLHWAHNGTAISGAFTVGVIATYADRDTGIFGTPVTLADITVADTVDISTTPQYRQYVTEVPLATSGGSGTTLDCDDIEIDGLVLITFKVSAVPTITGGTVAAPFLFTADIHYQSTGIGTKNNASPFYT
jgi:hypothetical protein